MDLEFEIRKAALENALKFKGKANPGAIVGKILGLDSSLKQNMKEISSKIRVACDEVNKLSQEQQKSMLDELDPDYEKKKKEKQEKNKQSRRELPPLRNAEQGKVITRIPPGPSKYLHVGHAMSFLINYLYSQEYDGKSILRFDDTNPEAEKQEYVDAIKKDLFDYLEIKSDEIVFASDDMEKFYDYAEKLIRDGDAYACDCSSEKISDDRRNMRECIHRNRAVEDNKKIWEKMRSGDAENNIIRLKIDMSHKNAVMRDPAIYRVVKTAHYRQGNKYNVWPLYDFESAIEDGLLGITHVLRSNEFDNRIELHHHIASLFDFKKVEYKHYGRISVAGATTKGREIRELIESGEYLGWDDPRLVTLQALKRRGIVKETLYVLSKICGLSKQNTVLDFSVIAAENRKILDETSKRFFFIEDPVRAIVAGASEKELTLPMHPERELGERKLKAGKEYLIERKDAECKKGEMLRLIDNINIIRSEDSSDTEEKESQIDFKFDSEDLASFKEKGKKIIHFLPSDADQLVDVEILMPDMQIMTGVAEKNISSLDLGEVIQFQRFGFCRLDSVDEQNGKKVFKFWYSHD